MAARATGEIQPLELRESEALDAETFSKSPKRTLQSQLPNPKQFCIDGNASATFLRNNNITNNTQYVLAKTMDLFDCK